MWNPIFIADWVYTKNRRSWSDKDLYIEHELEEHMEKLEFELKTIYSLEYYVRNKWEQIVKSLIPLYIGKYNISYLAYILSCIQKQEDSAYRVLYNDEIYRIFYGKIDLFK